MMVEVSSSDDACSDFDPDLNSGIVDFDAAHLDMVDLGGNSFDEDPFAGSNFDVDLALV